MICHFFGDGTEIKKIMYNTQKLDLIDKQKFIKKCTCLYLSIGKKK